MKTPRTIVLAGYALGILCMLPLLETLLVLGAPNPGSVDWRFGAVGRISQNLITPLLGLGILFAVALWRDHRAVLRTLAIATLAGALLAVAFLGTFVLDASTVRARVADDLLRDFSQTVWTATLRLVWVVVVAALMGWGGWVASGGQRRGKGKPRAGLVTGTREGTGRSETSA